MYSSNRDTEILPAVFVEILFNSVDLVCGCRWISCLLIQPVSGVICLELCVLELCNENEKLLNVY